MWCLAPAYTRIKAQHIRSTRDACLHEFGSHSCVELGTLWHYSMCWGQFHRLDPMPINRKIEWMKRPENTRTRHASETLQHDTTHVCTPLARTMMIIIIKKEAAFSLGGLFMWKWKYITGWNYLLSNWILIISQAVVRQYKPILLPL